MRIDWDTPIDVLMHGGNISYIDLNEDEIMHWKYIKRVKLANGKWRYYYDERDIDSAKLDLDKAVAARDRADRNLSEAESNSKKLEDEMAALKDQRNSSKNLGQWIRTNNAYANTKIKYLESVEKVKQAQNNKSASHEKVLKLEKKYKKKKISTFAARTISKGIVKVANLFSKIFG